MPSTSSSFIWYELMTNDVDAAVRFYGTVVGWSVQDSGQPGMDYRLWAAGAEHVGGLMEIPADAAANGMRPGWFGYVNVVDVDDSVARITAAGGTTYMPPTDIPFIGRMAMVADPQGAAIYVMAPSSDCHGPSSSFAPGQPGHGGWHELHTTDWQAALTFYGTQFGWAKSSAMDMGPLGTYLLFNAGDEAIGGMMNSPDFPRPMWLYYFNVDDIQAARARVNAAGGVVLLEPHEVPGGQWILQARDPQGAMFALVGPNKG